MRRSSLIFVAVLCCLGRASVAQPLLPYDQLKLVSTARTYDATDWKNLLHYSGKKSVINADSDFFLSPEGYKDPKAEYFSTLKAITDSNISKGNQHAICRYPARFNYILHSLNLKTDYFPKPKCTEYSEYLQKVPIDMVSVVFASENNISPSSMMGHTFIKLSGTNKNGLKEHSFSYFAALNNIDLKFYIDVLTVGIDGAYVLSPYSEKSAEYLYKEKRSLWEFDLKLTPREIERLKMHLWELKGSNIRYSLISHNCNTAVISILKTANSDLDSTGIKPFVTPVEYIQELHSKDRISNVSIDPTDYTREKINKYGIRYVLNANKSSRIELSQHANSHYTLVRLSPVYQDIHDINNAYFDEMESKIGEVAFGYSSKNDKAYVQEINLLNMRSILDYSIAKDYSKHFKLAFENNLGQTSTNLKPTVEIGFGYGAYVKDMAIYAIPKIGFRYNHFANAYISPEIGIIANLTDKIKFITSYEYYFNSRRNNRGFNSKYNTYLGYELTSNIDVYVEYNRYTGTKYSDDLIIGLFYKF